LVLGAQSGNFGNGAGVSFQRFIELAIILIPVAILWILRKRSATPHDYQDSKPLRAYRSALAFTIRHRYVFTALGLLTLIPRRSSL
jgi:Cu/Ag efflux pump CusA